MSTEKCFDLLLTRLCGGDAKLSSNSRPSLASRRCRHDYVIWDARRRGHLCIFPGVREMSASSMFLCMALDAAAPPLGAAVAACRLAVPSPEEIIEWASIAAYDFPVLLGPIKIVRGRSESDALLIGPKFLIVMSKCRGAMSSCADSAAGMGASKCCAGRLPTCAFCFPLRLFTTAGLFLPNICTMCGTPSHQCPWVAGMVRQSPHAAGSWTGRRVRRVRLRRSNRSGSDRECRQARHLRRAPALGLAAAGGGGIGRLQHAGQEQYGVEDGVGPAGVEHL